jgi:hypothetical protein
MPSAEQFAGPQYVLQKGLAVEELRDEIYAQLLKQTTENPNRDLLVKYWELIAFCSVTFLPTAKFIKYVGAHLQVQQQTEGNSGSIASLAHVCGIPPYHYTNTHYCCSLRLRTSSDFA